MTHAEGAIVGGRYRIEAKVGAGGMGAVYRATDEPSGSRVALKVMHVDAGTTQRFDEEARLLASVQHAAVVRLLDFGLDSPTGSPFLVMEWCDGPDLADVLASRAAQPVPIDDVVALGVRLAGALGAAHRAGVVHRDLKPSNIVVPGGDVRAAMLIDFGIARSIHRPRPLTAPGTIIGTPGYMAPEQARGERVDERSDLFSLGCVLFECLALQPAFVGRTPIEILAKLLIEDPPELRTYRPDVPRHVARLVHSLLAKSPSERPNGASVVASAMEVGEEPAPTMERTSASTAARVASFILAHETAGSIPAAWADVARSFGVRLEALSDSDALFLVPALESAADLTAMAARVALAAARVSPTAAIAVTTGRARLDGGRPLGAAISRATEMVAGAPSGLYVDEVTSALLPGRFSVERLGERKLLIAENEEELPARRLFGRPTPFVGRRRESAVLLGHFDEAIAERSPRFVVVTGPPGIGKTRLVAEALAEAPAASPQPRVVFARGDLLRRATSFGVILQCLSGLDESDPAAVDPVSATVHAEPFAAMVARLEAAFVRALDRALAQAPLILVVDDLQWCDAPSLDLLERTFRRVRDVPLLGLATARPELFTHAPPWRELVEEVRLGELTVRAALEIARAVLPDDPEASKLAEMATGSPFLLEELLRAKLENRPTHAATIVQARIDALVEPLRSFAHAGSLLSQPFGADILASATGTDRESALAVAERLVRADVFEPASATGSFAFRHGMLREAALEGFELEERRPVHLRVAQWLVAKDEPDPGVAAHHFEAAGDPAMALPLWLRGAWRALSAGDARATLERVAKALAGGAAGDVRAEALAIRAEASWATSDLAGSTASAEEALGLATKGSPAHGLALAACVRGWIQLGRGDEARAVTRELLDMRPRPSGARLLLRLLEAMLDLNDEALARELFAALDGVAVPPNPAVRGRWHRVRARYASHVGADVGSAIRELEAAREAFASCGEVAMLAAVDLELGWSLVSVAQYERAVAVLKRTVADSDARGANRVALQSRHVLACALGGAGELDEALAVSSEALRGYEASGDRLMLGGAHDVRAGLWIARGDWESAEAEAKLAVDALERWPTHRLGPLATLVDVLVRRGKVHDAEAHHAALAAQPAPAWAEVAVAVARARFLLASGARTEAMELVRGVRAALIARADALGAEDLRTGFLTRDRLHREALGLADELLGGSASRPEPTAGSA